jgi:hypothetical protein
MLDPDEEQADLDAARGDPGIMPASDEGGAAPDEGAPEDAGERRWFWWWPEW